MKIIKIINKGNVTNTNKISSTSSCTHLLVKNLASLTFLNRKTNTIAYIILPNEPHHPPRPHSRILSRSIMGVIHPYIYSPLVKKYIYSPLVSYFIDTFAQLKNSLNTQFFIALNFWDKNNWFNNMV